MSKQIANRVLGEFERYQKGMCSRDRALEEVSKIIDTYSEERPIVGYVRSGTLRRVLSALLRRKTSVKSAPGFYDFTLTQANTHALEQIHKELNV